MNTAHMSIQAAEFSEYTTTLLTEEGVGSFGLCMHSLQHSHVHILQRYGDTARSAKASLTINIFSSSFMALQVS